jgi:hypothetical protein
MAAVNAPLVGISGRKDVLMIASLSSGPTGKGYGAKRMVG